MNTTNYFDTFIAVADDCPVEAAEMPAMKAGKPTAASIQFEMIKNNPYQFDSDAVLFEVYARKNDLSKAELNAARKTFFSKGQACLRASPLTKRYGWGVHSNKEGKIAIYGVESPEYKRFVMDKDIKQVKAMKTARSGNNDQ